MADSQTTRPKVVAIIPRQWSRSQIILNQALLKARGRVILALGCYVDYYGILENIMLYNLYASFGIFVLIRNI